VISVDDITVPAVIRGFTFLQNIRVSAEIPVILIFPPDERAVWDIALVVLPPKWRQSKKDRLSWLEFLHT